MVRLTEAVERPDEQCLGVDRRLLDHGWLVSDRVGNLLGDRARAPPLPPSGSSATSSDSSSPSAGLALCVLGARRTPACARGGPTDERTPAISAGVRRCPRRWPRPPRRPRPPRAPRPSRALDHLGRLDLLVPLGLAPARRLGLDDLMHRLRNDDRVAVRVTCVPHPDGSSRTVPLACSPSQATVVSGSSLVILISPNSPRWRASDCATLHSAHSSGGDLTRVRLALCSSVMVGISIGGGGLLSAAELCSSRPERGR